MPRVASNSGIHYSQHVNAGPRNRPAPANSQPSATPFSELLDATSDQPPPPSAQDQTPPSSGAHASAAGDASAHQSSNSSRSEPSNRPKDSKATPAAAKAPPPNVADASVMLPDDHGKPDDAEAKGGRDSQIARSAPKQNPLAGMMQLLTGAADDHGKPDNADANNADAKSGEDSKIAGPAPAQKPAVGTTPQLLAGPTDDHGKSDSADAKSGEDSKIAGSAPTQNPVAGMMQQLPTGAADDQDANPDTADAAPLAALKGVEKVSGARTPNATARSGAHDQAPTPTDADATPATADASAPDGASTATTAAADGAAKHATIELSAEGTRMHAGKPNQPDDGNQKPGDVTTIADFEAHLPQAMTDAKSNANGASTLGMQQPGDHATAASASAAPAQAPAMPVAVPLSGVAVEIAARAQGGSNRFEIRLDPPDLGRVDVHLNVDRDGHVTSHLVVDRPDTLDALRKDAPELERALQQAGLKTSDNGLQFSLRDQSFAGRDQTQQPAVRPTFISDSELGPVDGAQAVYNRVLRIGGLDIRV